VFEPLHIYTDGSFADRLKRLPGGTLLSTTQCVWAAVLIRAGKRVDALHGAAPLTPDRNITGEAHAVIHGLERAAELGFSSVVVFHDYNGLSHWANGDWEANSETAKWYQTEYSGLSGRFASLEFRKVKGHSGVYWNEFVDDLAARPRVFPSTPLKFSI